MMKNEAGVFDITGNTGKRKSEFLLSNFDSCKILAQIDLEMRYECINLHRIQSVRKIDFKSAIDMNQIGHIGFLRINILKIIWKLTLQTDRANKRSRPNVTAADKKGRSLYNFYSLFVCGKP